MKKIFATTVGLILIFGFLAISRQSEDTESSLDKIQKDGSITLLTYDNLVNYSLKNNKFEKQAEQPINIKDEQNFDYAEINNQIMFSLGHVQSSKNDFQIGKIDVQTGMLTTEKRDAMPITGLGDADNYFYTMTSQSGVGTTIQQFNDSGETIGTAILETPSVGSKIVGSQDKIFMLAGVEDKEISKTIYPTKVLVYDEKNLELLDTYQFDNPNDETLIGLTSIEVVNQALYMPVTARRNKTNGQWNESKEILVFDLSKEETSFIQVKESFPTFIQKDKAQENLLILHESNMLEKYVLSIYNLKVESVNTLDIQSLLGEEEISNFIFTTTKDGKLIMDTGGSLILYDLNSREVLDKIELDKNLKDRGLYIYSHESY